jgi:hypothetical protein
MSRRRLSVITGALALAAALVEMCGVADAGLIGVDISTITSAGNSNNDDVGLTVTYFEKLF